MKPESIKGYREREVRKLIKERRQLYNKAHALGYRELEKPFRKGWYKEFVLSPRLERYKFKPEIEEIVKYFDCLVWGKSKEEAQKKWDASQSKFLIYNNVPTISKKRFNKLSEKAKKFCTYFEYKLNKKIRSRYYVRIPKNAFRIKLTRAYITHSKIIDPEIEKRISLIESQFIKKGWYEITELNFSYKYRWKVDDIKICRKQTKQKLNKLVLELPCLTNKSQDNLELFIPKDLDDKCQKLQY